MNICYYPAGDRAFASSRMRVWRIVDALRLMGHTCQINDARGCEIAVFQKRFELITEMQQLRAQGIRVIVDVDDWIPNAPIDYADMVTIDTAYKLKLYPTARIVPDALDLDHGHPIKTEHREKLTRAAWFGNADNAYHATNAAVACDRLGIELVMITDLGNTQHQAYWQHVTGVQWTSESVDQEIIQADVVLCPYVYNGTWSEDWVKSKSANRPIKAWTLGMPVIGTPIPSYVEVGMRHTATTVQEWIAALTSLQSAASRQLDARLGSATAQAFRVKQVANQWLNLFGG